MYRCCGCQAPIRAEIVRPESRTLHPAHFGLKNLLAQPLIGPPPPFGRVGSGDALPGSHPSRRRSLFARLSAGPIRPRAGSHGRGDSSAGKGSSVRRPQSLPTRRRHATPRMIPGQTNHGRAPPKWHGVHSMKTGSSISYQPAQPQLRYPYSSKGALLRHACQWMQPSHRRGSIAGRPTGAIVTCVEL